MPPPRRGFRFWLLENYRLLYTLDLITAYASLMLYFASLVLIGRPSLLSRLMLAILIVSGAVAATPYLTSRGVRRTEFERLLKTRRPRRTEQVEIIIAAGLWLLIGIAVATVFLRSDH